jgi:hypothetical protein
MTYRKERHKIDPVDAAPGDWGDIRLLTTAGGGTSIGGTAVYIPLPENKTNYLELIARDFSTSVVAQVSLLPRLTVLKTTDDGTTFTDYSDAAQDGSASTDVVLSSLGTLAQGDYVYVGAPRKFAGIAVDVDGANVNAATMAVHYWSGNQWNNITPTDGTASGGATFGQDGNVTWTVPTNWVKKSINGVELYWARISVSAAMDSSTTQNSWWAMPAFTAFEMVANEIKEIAVVSGQFGVGGLKVTSDGGGTAKIIVNAGSGPGVEF